MAAKRKHEVINFRISKVDHKRAHDKAYPVSLAKYMRAITGKWLDGEIEISDADLWKYNQKVASDD